MGVIVAGVWSVALMLIDVKTRRLPDLLTLPAAAVALGYCFVEPAGWWGMIWPVLYAAVGTGIGGGDVKLAVPLGVALAVTGGVGAVLAGMLLGSALTLVFLLLTRSRETAHGPSMLAAAWIVGLACTTAGAI